MTKRVLCFGDSNTFGYIPRDFRRYDKNTRWTGILSQLSKDKYTIIEAGCNNRTAFTDNPAGFEQTGYKILPSILKSSQPDIVILAIGTNDLQFAFSVNEKDIEQGIKQLIDIIRSYAKEASIIIASPSVIAKEVLSGYFSAMFDITSVQKSHLLAKIYKKVADESNCAFIDLNKVASVSKLDGLHYMPEEHKKIACAIYELLCNF